MDSFLTQHVTDFTRHCPGQRPYILDLVFTDDPNSIDCIQHYHPLGSSDHDCLVFQYKCYEMCPSSDDVSYKYCYWTGNYVAICQELHTIDWNTLLHHDSIETILFLET